MIDFLRARGVSLAVVVLVMIFISATQVAVSYIVGQGPLVRLMPIDFRGVLPANHVLRVVILILTAPARAVIQWASGLRFLAQQ